MLLIFYREISVSCQQWYPRYNGIWLCTCVFHGAISDCSCVISSGIATALCHIGAYWNRVKSLFFKCVLQTCAIGLTKICSWQGLEKSSPPVLHLSIFLTGFMMLALEYIPCCNDTDETAVPIFRWPSCFSLGMISAAQSFSAVLSKLDFRAPGTRSRAVPLLQC